MSDQLQADSVLQSINAFAAILGLSYRGPKLQNVGAGDPLSKILIDGVQLKSRGIRGVLGSKQSSNGYTADRMLYAGLDLQFSVIQRYRIAVLSVSASKYTGILARVHACNMAKQR